jgi:hypothetical protein
MLRQRHPRQRDSKHIAFVRANPCCIPFCGRQAEAAHLRMACNAIGKLPTGMQEKPDDKWATPLCCYHHRTGIGSQHSMGEDDFWHLAGLNPFDIAARLWIASGGAERSLLPTPVPRPKASKPRKPPGLRRKIMPGRPLQSRGFQTERRT